MDTQNYQEQFESGREAFSRGETLPPNASRGFVAGWDDACLKGMTDNAPETLNFYGDC